MVMSLWWVTLILLALGMGVWALCFWNRRSLRRRPRIVANSAFLESVPSFRRAQRTARTLRVALVAMAVLGLVGASVLSGRVASERIQSPSFASRDIVLCLDISGSMYEYDTEILHTFAELTESFHGERIALSIYNSTSRTVFPLTNDYDLVRRELDKGATALDFDEQAYRTGSKNYTDEQVRAYADFIEGTRGVDDEASLVPDGLAACGQLFDQGATDRSRSVIMATDNEVNGKPIFTLAEAAKAVERRRATLYTFYPGAFECSRTCAEELEKETEAVGGHFYSSSDPQAIPTIINSIQKTQAKEMGATPIVIRTDRPLIPFCLALIAVIGIIVAGWRAR